MDMPIHYQTTFRQPNENSIFYSLIITSHSQVEYEILESSNDNTNEDWRHFKIDPATGEIVTAKTFDREDVEYYQIIVSAFETNKPSTNQGMIQ